MYSKDTIETQKEDLLVVRRDYPANKEEEEAIQEGQVIRHTRGPARYKRVSNMVRRLTRRDHQDHLSCQLVGNQQTFWRWLKNVRGQSAGIPNLKCMGNTAPAPAISDWYGHCVCVNVKKVGGCGGIPPQENFNLAF